MSLRKKSEKQFAKFRKNTIGHNAKIITPYGEKTMTYADWTASGRLYNPIEKALSQKLGAYIANPHTSSNTTGTLVTRAYKEARNIVKKHVHAGPDDVLLFSGTGTTGAIWKLIRILNLHTTDKKTTLPEEKRPIVFITHMEHHSNQISWQETLADVVIIDYDEEGRPDLDHLASLLEKYKNRDLKITSVNATSNIIGIKNDCHKIAEISHAHGAFCFVDYACSAPYVKIDMHPEKPEQKIDAIFFSPHKFLGGPGSSGVLIFDKKLYNREVPDSPGGGCVSWTTPWQTLKYFDDIEQREDAGTPGFLQSIKAALAIQLKEKMGVKKMQKRDKEISDYVFHALSEAPDLEIFETSQTDRLPIFSFNIKGVHFNLVTRLLNDRFGIQARGGCACAGTYAHYLLDLDRKSSKELFDKVDAKDLKCRPGWARISFHPTMTNKEVKKVCDAVIDVCNHHKKWGQDYRYDKKRNQYYYQKNFDEVSGIINKLYKI